MPSKMRALWTSPRLLSWRWFKIKALITPARMSELIPEAVKRAKISSKETTWANKRQASAKVLSATRGPRWASRTEKANPFKRWSKVDPRSSANAAPGSTCRERKWTKFWMTRKIKFHNSWRLPKPDAPPMRRQLPPRNPDTNKRCWTTCRATANSHSQQISASLTSTARITNTLSKSNNKPECRSPASNSTQPKAKVVTFHPCTPKFKKGLRL